MVQNPQDLFQMKKKLAINNKRLLVENHQYRMKDSMLYGDDFIILPRYVFKPLSHWYECD